MKGIKSFRRTFLLIAALYLACGISLLVWPAQSGLVICYVFGGISLLYGAVQIIRYCCNAAVSIFRYELVTGILCCAFGLFVILRADMVLAVLPFVFGCAIVFDSVMTLQNAIDLRRLGFSRWWLMLPARSACCCFSNRSRRWPWCASSVRCWCWTAVRILSACCV